MTGATTERSSRPRATSDETEDEREDEEPVAAGRLGGVEGLGLGSADVGVGGVGDGGADRRDASLASSEPGVGVEDGLDLAHATGAGDLAGRGDPVDGADDGRGERRPGRCPRHDGRRVGGAGGEGLGEALARGDGLGLLEELVGPVEPGADLGHAGRRDGEQQRRWPSRRRQGGARRCRRSGARASGSRPGWPGPSRGTLGQKIHRPKTTRAAGQHDEHEGGGHDDTDGAGEAETPGRREGRQQEREQADDDGRGAGQDGLRGAGEGLGHRVAAVGVHPQLVAVARDEQQRVVGAGTEDEHREDADRRLVPLDVEGGQGARREHGRELVGDADHGERHEPEHRAAVGDDEEQGDDAGRRAEQAEVGAVEDRGEVGLDRGRPGDLGGEPVGQVGLGRGAQLGHDVRGLGGVVADDGDEDRGGGAVLGDDAVAPR